ncbi:predicted protein [Nematostella vectensis]|uniref:Mab21-like 3 n=1 Tax=Nematostella vectensis TaxID=45351 RepID=A7SLQ5_NEMVE|nr:mab21-like 3 [Nematostella vectensis]EDO35339.1 predicted protein [Nematostella vectensis]|eukprot:XP_001627439.1 predicted protein [Nematostella vectensis]
MDSDNGSVGSPLASPGFNGTTSESPLASPGLNGTGSDSETSWSFDTSDTFSEDLDPEKWSFEIPKTPDRRRSIIKKPQIQLDPVSAQLYEFHENRVRLSVERKSICEEIAYNTVHKCLRKIETVDNRFRANSLVSQGIPYDGLQAEEKIQLVMLVQLSLGPTSAMYIARDPQSGDVRMQMTSSSRGVWDDCLTLNGFVSAAKVNALLRKYIKKAVALLNIHIKEKNTSKLPKLLSSIELERGKVVRLTVNKDISIDVQPAFVKPDSRLDPSRKSCPSSSHIVCKQVSQTEMAWRLSFYVGEKNKLRAIGTEGCRIPLLRILTEIRDNEDELKLLSTVHLMHILFHESDAIPDSNEWTTEKISVRFFGLLDRMKKALKDGELLHYFMQPPDYEPFNLFAQFDGKTLSDMYDIVEDIRQTSGMEVLEQEGKDRRQSMWPWELDLTLPAGISG